MSNIKIGDIIVDINNTETWGTIVKVEKSIEKEDIILRFPKDYKKTTLQLTKLIF